MASPRSQRRLIDILEKHGDAGAGIGHRDATAHRASTDDGRTLDVVSGRRRRHARRFSRHPARRKTSGASARLSVETTHSAKIVAFADRAFVERERQRAFDGVDRGKRCAKPTRRRRSERLTQCRARL